MGMLTILSLPLDAADINLAPANAPGPLEEIVVVTSKIPRPQQYAVGAFASAGRLALDPVIVERIEIPCDPRVETASPPGRYAQVTVSLRY